MLTAHTGISFGRIRPFLCRAFRVPLVKMKPLKLSSELRASLGGAAFVTRREVQRFISSEAGGAGFQQLHFCLCIIISPIKTKSSPPDHCIQAFLPSFVSTVALLLAQALKQP